MKATDLVEAIQSLLMDVLVFLIPGAVFLLALWPTSGDGLAGIAQASLGWPAATTPDLGATARLRLPLPPESVFEWTILVLLSYVSGYVLQGIGEVIVLKFADSLSKFSRFTHVFREFKQEKELKNDIEKAQWFLEARKRLSIHTKADLSSLGYRELRNVAMSTSPGWVRHVYRYTYTGQLCLGTATALIVTGIVVLLLVVLGFVPGSGASIPPARCLWLIPLAVAVPFLLDRRYRYYSIQMRIPFSIALAETARVEDQSNPGKSHANAAKSSTPGGALMGTTSVYLSGGFHSGWQDQVISRCSGLEFFDPRSHGMEQPAEYTAWDLAHVRLCDILFAYVDKDNPSGFGVALEIGYAKAMGKTVVLVDEKSKADSEFSRYFAMVRETADVSFQSLDQAIAYLTSFRPAKSTK